MRKIADGHLKEAERKVSSIIDTATEKSSQLGEPNFDVLGYLQFLQKSVSDVRRIYVGNEKLEVKKADAENAFFVFHEKGRKILDNRAQEAITRVAAIVESATSRAKGMEDPKFDCASFLRVMDECVRDLSNITVSEADRDEKEKAACALRRFFDKARGVLSVLEEKGANEIEKIVQNAKQSAKKVVGSNAVLKMSTMVDSALHDAGKFQKSLEADIASVEAVVLPNADDRRKTAAVVLLKSIATRCSEFLQNCEEQARERKIAVSQFEQVNRHSENQFSLEKADDAVRRRAEEEISMWMGKCPPREWGIVYMLRTLHTILPWASEWNRAHDEDLYERNMYKTYENARNVSDPHFQGQDATEYQISVACKVYCDLEEHMNAYRYSEN